jgi:hypothetical protein
MYHHIQMITFFFSTFVVQSHDLVYNIQEIWKIDQEFQKMKKLIVQNSTGLLERLQVPTS